jgi:hypothetical protein
MSWPWARNVRVPAAGAGALTGLEVEDAAELLEELQAVTSKAAQASTAQAAACRVLRVFVVNMNFRPLGLTLQTLCTPPWLGAAWPGRETTARSA